MGITFYIRRRKAGDLYLQIKTEDTNNYIRIESKDEGMKMGKKSESSTIGSTI